MDLDIGHRVAMVAAASKGLGKASALALAREGCKVSVCGRDPETLDRVLKELEVAGPNARHLAVPCDVAEAADLERWHHATVDRLGLVDILVTNTGGPPAATFHTLTEEQWLAGVQSTLLNVVRMAHLVLPSMQARRWGRIVHLTSYVAKEPSVLLTLSSTLRAGLSALTKTMAREYARDYGLRGYSSLPLGIRKNLARGKPLPPGIAKKMVRGSKLERLPKHSGYEWRVAGTDLILISVATAVIADILYDVFD